MRNTYFICLNEWHKIKRNVLDLLLKKCKGYYEQKGRRRICFEIGKILKREYNE